VILTAANAAEMDAVQTKNVQESQKKETADECAIREEAERQKREELRKNRQNAEIKALKAELKSAKTNEDRVEIYKKYCVKENFLACEKLREKGCFKGAETETEFKDVFYKFCENGVDFDSCDLWAQMSKNTQPGELADKIVQICQNNEDGCYLVVDKSQNEGNLKEFESRFFKACKESGVACDGWRLVAQKMARNSENKGEFMDKYFQICTKMGSFKDCGLWFFAAKNEDNIDENNLKMVLETLQSVCEKTNDSLVCGLSFEIAHDSGAEELVSIVKYRYLAALEDECKRGYLYSCTSAMRDIDDRAKSEEMRAKFSELAIKKCENGSPYECKKLLKMDINEALKEKLAQIYFDKLLKNCQEFGGEKCEITGFGVIPPREYYEKLMEILTSGCELNAQDCVFLAGIYTEGVDNIPKNESEAQKYLQKALKTAHNGCKKNNENVGQNCAALAHLQTLGLFSDAQAVLEASCDDGSAPACDLAAQNLEPQKALNAQNKACAQDAKYCESLFKAYRDGSKRFDVKPNLDEMHKFGERYCQISENKSIDACLE